jgi:hypothetical protein
VEYPPELVAYWFRALRGADLRQFQEKFERLRAEWSAVGYLSERDYEFLYILYSDFS